MGRNSCAVWVSLATRQELRCCCILKEEKELYERQRGRPVE